MTRWTEEQGRAIALSERRLLISAAAGSGKTAVLTERIVSRVLDETRPVDIDRLLIMTFTRAAAAEMRERIRRRMEDSLEAAVREGKTGLAARAKRELAALDAAQITTIDSFCLSVLREHADRLEVDPAFRVGGEEELRILKSDVLETLLEEQYEAGETGFLRFAEAFSQGKADLGIGEEILSLHQFAESMPWPEEWFLRCEEEAKQEGEASETEPAWAAYMAAELRALGEELLPFAAEAKTCCEAGGLGGYEAAVNGDFEKIRALCRAESYAAAKRAMGAFQSFDRLKANKKDSDKELAEQVKALREFWKKPLKKAAEDFGDEENGIASGDAETVLTLISLTRNFSARYRAKKQEKKLLDFSDLEHEALALFWEKDESGMKRPSEIAREYRSHFAEIYVDEYQDSNGVQEELLRAIEAGRLFLVGDIKQSIYGFRHAKPELFAEKYRSYHKDSGGELPPDLDTRVDLRKNFRSREDVLASCNAVFRRLMREELGGVAYDDDAALYPGAAFPAGEDGEYATELLLCEREAESEEADAVLEAELVARRIRELMDPETGIKVSDGAGGLRPAAYGDIAVLLRATSGQAERFVEVLMSHGIPALAEQKTGYFDATEVRTVLSLLRAIDNPFRDISLAAVLSASVGGLSEEELAALETEKLEILRRAGYPVDYLRPAYRCETCRDTGFVDGKKCRCFRQKIIARLCRQGRLAASIERENFDRFSLDYYSAAREVPKLAMSERAYMEQLVLPQCRRYLENFDREKGNLLFTGKPGLGKTFLSHCIAGELLKRGHTVLYLSAEELFSLLAATQWRQRAESDEEKIKAREEKEFREYIYGCEFLIIDDLGTEFSNAFTTAAFFSLLNERLLSRLGTLISTNLDPKQLKAQYTERSTSRILGEYDILPFYGSDIRAQKRRQ